MRKILMWILLVTLLTQVAFAASRFDDAVSDVQLTFLNQEPDPAQPGQYVEIRLKLINEGGIAVDNVMVEFMEDYPFSIDNPDDKIVEVGRLSKFQANEQSVFVEFEPRIDARAVEGTNDFRVKYSFTLNSRPYEFVKEFDVELQSNFPDVSIDSVVVDPEVIAPGEKGTVSIVVTNTAPTPLYDVTLQLNLTSADLPLAPIGSATERSIPVLLSGESETITYTTIVSPDAASGVYKVPLEISFADYLFAETSREDLVGIVVGDEPDITVSIDNNDLYKGFSKGTIPIKIVNKGAIDAKFLLLEIKPTDAFTMLSPSELYVGNLDSDDFETEDLSVVNNKEGADTLVVPVTLTYEDANFNDYQKEFMLEIPLLAQDLVQEQQSNSGGIIIVVIIIVGVGYFIWRRKRKKKHV